MDEYLAILAPLLGWVRDGAVLAAALVILVTAVLDLLSDPDEAPWWPLAVRMVGAAIVVRFVRTSHEAVAFFTPGAYGSPPPLAFFLAAPLAWLTRGVLATAAAALLWVIWRRWSAEPQHFTVTKAVLAACGVGLAALLLRQAVAIITAAARAGA
jgi:hypothetical protein